MDLEHRLERLERENRRLKLAGGAALIGVLAAAALIGAATSQEIPDLVETRELRVIGDNGDWFFRVAYEEDFVAGVVDYRTHLSDARLAPWGLDLQGSPGTRITLRNDELDEELYLAPQTIVLREGPGLSLEDIRAFEAGRPSNDPSTPNKVLLSIDGFELRDAGDTRLELGRVDLINASTQAETYYPAAVVLYDADGNVIWRAPR